jgi:hypothetical protein
MTDETGTKRSNKRRPWRWIAVTLACCGFTMMLAGLLLPATRILPLIGFGVVLVSVLPYVFDIRIRFQEADEFRVERHREALESMRESHEAFLATQEEQLRRLKEITAKIEVTTRVFRLERIEEEVYAEILGVDADDVLAMEWPKDGLRDTVIVYFAEGPAVVYPLTIDQMNQAAETINQRMSENEDQP